MIALKKYKNYEDISNSYNKYMIIIIYLRKILLKLQKSWQILLNKKLLLLS